MIPLLSISLAVAAIIGSIIAALSAAGAGVASYVSQRKTNQLNQEQYEDWKSYNSPQQQMQRLADAGLNPFQVSNVNNTLSQPFQAGTNSGISELLSGLSGSAHNFANHYQSAFENEQSRALQRQNLDIQREKNNLSLIGLQIKNKLADNALKVGDARTALLLTQGSLAQINRNLAVATLPYKIESAKYDSFIKALDYNFNKEFLPQKLLYYAPMQRAMINNIVARTNHLSWQEAFSRERLMNDIINRKADREDKYYFFGKKDLHSDKKDILSRDYFDLRRSQFQWSIMKDLFNAAFPHGLYY